ncbi:hypothetical protein ACF0H5_017123 [Mactra antiquata]
MEEMEADTYLDWDITYQNEDGDTALHVAIASDVDNKILQSLFEKGADVNVANANGKTPFECLNHGSMNTALNLLKLEKSFDLKDENGDTFLHVLMDRVGDSVWGIRRTGEEGSFGASDQHNMIDKFWKYVLENSEQFAINVNTQNKFGSTPLHIAADNWPSMKSLEVMLSSFEHVDPLICDEAGDNFLHIYCRRHRRIYKQVFEFHDNLFKGRLTYLPNDVLIKLLNTKNKDKNTPLHILIKMCDGKTVQDFQDILEAGADPNMRDWIGDTPLHCIFKKYINQTDEDTNEPEEYTNFIDDHRNDIILLLDKHGADINATNTRGESPIFLAKSEQNVATLLELGANVNLKNKLMQTPLLYLVSKEQTNAKILEMYIKSDADVFAGDIHGSNVLHYIAWHGYHVDFLSAINNPKLKSSPDNLGQLPCDVAYIQGHKEIFKQICDCPEDAHPNKEHFNLQNDVIDIHALINNSDEFQNKLDRIKSFRGDQIAKLLCLPGLGAVKFEGEADQIRTVANEIIKNICKKLSETNEFWACSIVQSGSVGEITKVNAPNEFDFVIVLDKLSSMCYADQKQETQHQGFALLKLKPEFADDECKKFFTEENYLDVSTVRRELMDVLDELYTTEVPFQHPNISFVVGNNKSIFSPTFNFTFYWKGCLYKKLLVDIDLVPACRVNGWWPQDSNIEGLHGDTGALKDYGAILLLQTDMSEMSDGPDTKLRVSAMTAEKEHMLNLPQVARDAYKVCKILCHGRICPDLHLEADIPIKKAITSYMLKNTMFHVMKDFETQHDKHRSEPSASKILRYDENVDLHEVVKYMFLKLSQFSKDEKLPSFVLPWQNVFTFNSNVAQHHNHFFCAFRSAFIKVVLQMLGEKQDFSDIDVEACAKAVQGRERLEDVYGFEEIDSDEYNVDMQDIADHLKNLEKPLRCNLPPGTFHWALLKAQAILLKATTIPLHLCKEPIPNLERDGDSAGEKERGGYGMRGWKVHRGMRVERRAR